VPRAKDGLVLSCFYRILEKLLSKISQKRRKRSWLNFYAKRIFYSLKMIYTGTSISIHLGRRLLNPLTGMALYFIVRHLRKFRNALQNQVANTTMAITRNFPEDTRIFAPKGEFILWIELGKHIDEIDFFYKAKDNNLFTWISYLESKKYKTSTLYMG